MRNKDKLLTALENLLFRSLVENKSLSAGQRLEGYMDTVDLDGLYEEIHAVHKAGDKPSRCQLLVTRLVELYKPDLFKTDKPKTKIVKIEASSLDDLHAQLMKVVDAGDMDADDAEDIFQTIKDEDSGKGKSLDEVRAECRELGKKMGIPDEILDAVDKSAAELTGILAKARADKDKNHTTH